jgi:hypothetical protein
MKRSWTEPPFAGSPRPPSTRSRVFVACQWGRLGGPIGRGSRSVRAAAPGGRSVVRRRVLLLIGLVLLIGSVGCGEGDQGGERFVARVGGVEIEPSEVARLERAMARASGVAASGSDGPSYTGCARDRSRRQEARSDARRCAEARREGRGHALHLLLRKAWVVLEAERRGMTIGSEDLRRQRRRWNRELDLRGARREALRFRADLEEYERQLSARTRIPDEVWRRYYRRFGSRVSSFEEFRETSAGALRRSVFEQRLKSHYGGLTTCVPRYRIPVVPECLAGVSSGKRAS